MKKLLRNLASNQRFIRLGQYVTNSYIFLKTPTHLHFSLNYVCMYFLTVMGLSAGIPSQINHTYSGKIPLLVNNLLDTANNKITMILIECPIFDNSLVLSGHSAKRKIRLSRALCY